MAIENINIGSAPNDGTGDTIRDAFDKCNGNFTDLDTTKFDTPIGDTSQYVRGDGSLATLPTSLAQNLQQVTDEGNATTNPIIVEGLNGYGHYSQTSLNNGSFETTDLVNGDYSQISGQELTFGFDILGTPKFKGINRGTSANGSIQIYGLPDKIDGTYTLATTEDTLATDRLITEGRNSTGSTLYKGTVIYISGSTGTQPNFTKAQANSESTSARTFGIVLDDIANNSNGYVVNIGSIIDLDTRTTATHPFTSDTLADGDTVYLSPSTAGYITNVKPSAPNHLVYIGKVIRTSPTNGTIVYQIQNGYELDELHDVAISSVANNDALVYESASTLWKNKPLTTEIVSPYTNKNYVTDAQLVIIGNTSGTNSGDNAINSQYSGLAGRISQDFIVNGSFTGTSPSDNTTYYVGPSSNIMATTETSRRFKFPYATTIRTVCLALGQTIAGTNETVSVYIRNSTSGTETLVGTFTSDFTAGTGAFFNFSGLSITIPNTTDFWTFKIVCPTWATNPVAWTGSFFVIAN